MIKIRIILASASPRRFEILRLMGIKDITVIASEVDESIGSDITPSEIVMELSRRKALDVSSHCLEDDIVIAADTIVCYNKLVYGKPHDKAEALDMLMSLSGNTHTVYSGLCLIRNGEMLNDYSCSEVTFKRFTEKEALGYISTGEPMDKAGAYAIQGMASVFVDSIKGDFFTIMGLPAGKLYDMLKKLGVDIF